METEGAMKTNTARGFTLIEVIIVVIIAGILVTVALRSASQVTESARTEEAKLELQALSDAITGNPDLNSGGVRSDFGYLGDVGALPPNLDALLTNPGGYGTWKGPYVRNRFAQDPADFKTDPWGTPYNLSGTEISSNGSGSPIVRRFAADLGSLLHNPVSGTILDSDGTPPGAVYRDSLMVDLTYPDGSGGLTTISGVPDPGGYFQIDSIPVGNHDLRIVYQPDSDTLSRFVTVLPGGSSYSEYIWPENLWAATGGSGIEFIANSDTLHGSHCNELSFSIINLTGAEVTISSLTVSWTSPTAYVTAIEWNGSSVYSGGAVASGAPTVLGSPQTIPDGAVADIDLDEFRAFSNGGGPKVDMTGVEFTIEFSDGSSITLTADYCD